MNKSFEEALTVRESHSNSSLHISPTPGFDPAAPVAADTEFHQPPASLTLEVGFTVMDTPHRASPPDASAHAAAPSPSDEDMLDSASATADDSQNEITDEQKREAATHVTIWNRLECRKIAGNAAPLRRNLRRYLERHPGCEEYKGQDKLPGYTNPGSDPSTGNRLQTDHVPIWHCWEQRKVTGNAAPLRKNLEAYLRKHPECEVYAGQDKKGPKPASRRASWPVAATPDAGATNATQVQLFNSGEPSDQQSARFAGSDNQHRACTEPIGYLPTHSDPAAPVVKNGHIFTTTLVSDRPELTYSELASSWSNHPEWAGSANVARSSNPGLSIPQTPSHSYSDASAHAEDGISSMEVEISGLEIPSLDAPDVGMDLDANAFLTDDQTGPNTSEFLDLNDRSLDLGFDDDSSEMDFMESPCMYERLVSEMDQVCNMVADQVVVEGPSTSIGGPSRHSNFDEGNIGADVDAYDKYISEAGEQLNNKNHASDYGGNYVEDTGERSEDNLNGENGDLHENGSFSAGADGSSEMREGAGPGNQ